MEELIQQRNVLTSHIKSDKSMLQEKINKLLGKSSDELDTLITPLKIINRLWRFSLQGKRCR